MYGYNYDYGQRRRRWPAAVGVGAAAALLVGASYLLGSHSSRSDTDPAAAPASAPASSEATNAPPPVLAPGQASDDPVASATTWLRAYRSLSYTDPNPTAWIDRVRPVVTDRLAGEYDSYREGSTGAQWGDFVAQRCTSTVENAGGVIPSEAPRTATAVNVQLSGALQARCQTENDDERLLEDLAATVVVIRGHDGLWRVDQRLY